MYMNMIMNVKSSIVIWNEEGEGYRMMSHSIVSNFLLCFESLHVVELVSP